MKNLFLFLFLLLLSCNKTNITHVEEKQQFISGVKEDNPKEVEKVTLLTSNNFIKLEKQIPLRGKPVRDRELPYVIITSPANGSIADGTVNINVTATDNVGVTQVSLSVNGSVIGLDNLAPYTFAWNSDVPNGNYTLTATARDAANNISNYSITLIKNVIIVDPPVDTSGYEMKTPIPGNQGGEGSCIGWSVGYGARSIHEYYKTGATSFSNSINVFSPEFLYNQIKFSVDCNSGTAMQTALDFIKNNGITTWDMMPYTADNCSLLPNAEQSLQAQNYKIDGYYKIYTTDTEMMKSMIRQNKPIIVSINLDNLFLAAKSGFIWENTGSGLGIGHSVIIVGYNENLQAWKIMNSFGTSWGTNGFAYMKYDMFPTRTGTWCYVIQ